jgi:hypothetical protein
MACPDPANGVATCTAGTCGFACDVGYDDCNGVAGDGCEQALATAAHCGACDTACVSPGDCATGTCVVACTMPTADCNTDATDGCETNLAFDESNCGACGTSCGNICNGGECYADCGGAPCTSCPGPDRCECNSSGGCGYDCTGATCDVRCQGSGITCTILGDDAGRFQADCRGGADCAFDGRYGNDVDVVCQNAGTTCAVDCRGATSCDVDCDAEAECTLLCDGPGCGYLRCDGGAVVDCGSGRSICNGSC